MKGLMFRKPCQHLLRMLSSDCVRSCAFLKSGCFHVLLKQHCFMKSLRLKLTEQLSFEVEIQWAPFICNLKLDTTTWSWIDNLLIYLSSFVFTFCIVLVRTMADSDDSDNTMTTRRWCSGFCKSWCGVCYGCRSLATSGNRTDTRHARAGETAQRNSAGSQRYCICELCLLAPFFFSNDKPAISNPFPVSPKLPVIGTKKKTYPLKGVFHSCACWWYHQALRLSAAPRAPATAGTPSSL